jgi:hypothetical protein
MAARATQMPDWSRDHNGAIWRGVAGIGFNSGLQADTVGRIRE